MDPAISERIAAATTALALAVAERDQLAEALPGLRSALAKQRAGLAGAPDALAPVLARTGVDAITARFLWSAIAVALDPRASVHAAALYGPRASRGMSVELFARIDGLPDDDAWRLAAGLAGDHPLVREGILKPESGEVSAAARAYLVAPRVLAHVVGDATVEAPLRVIARPSPQALELDARQHATIAELTRALEHRAVLALEGPRGTGRSTALALASELRIVELDLERVDELAPALLALRRELVLGGGIAVLANVEAASESRERRALFAQFLAAWDHPAIVETSTAFDIPTALPVRRVRWPQTGQEARRRLWHRHAPALSGAELDALASRYAVGPRAIERAAESARMAGALDADGITRGLRHNIVESMGAMCQRVEVTQQWEDLVLAPDIQDQVVALVARVGCAHQVLDRWGYRAKLAKGGGVSALFSGPPGTGKTMVAGLIARQLELDLYQVDLSQIVSKYVGETEKQIARVFDAAEQGHALLLFDEADALFAQRSSDVKSAVDRYANLEVNYLLQRVEAFGGITILTTNFDKAIDRALKRRLAAHIVFDVPEEAERRVLWQRLTFTERAPLARDVDFAKLARTFPRMTGANIRNAALAAAFLAASADEDTITQAALERAGHAEYRSMGHGTV